MPLRLIPALILMLLAPLAATAVKTPFRVRHLDASPGLSNTMINKVTEDSAGFVWIGTSSGLYRYDGYTLKDFRGKSLAETSVLNNYVEDIQEDADGRLWVMADSRWLVYDPLTGKKTDDLGPLLKEYGIEGNVSTVFNSPDKTLWLAVDGKGVYSVKDGRTRLAPLPGRVGGKVTDIVSVPGGVACVSSDGNLTLIDRNGTKVTKSTKAPEIASENADYVYVAYPDRKQRLWIIRNDRLMLYDIASGQWLNHLLPDNGRTGVVKTMFQDKAGNLWIARDHQGVERVVTDNGGIRFEKVETNDALSPNNTVTSFFEDSSGTLWLGTYKQGLFFHNGSSDKFGMERFADTNCMVEAGDGQVWVGTDDTGLWKWNPSTGEATRFPDPADGPQPPAITSLAKGNDGILYIGSFSRGIRTLKDGKFTHLATGSDLDRNYVWSMLFDREGRLWAGTLGGGLFSLDPTTGETKAFKTSNSGLASDYVLSGLVSEDGRLYFGSSSGLSVLDPATGEIKSYLDKETPERPGAQNVNQIYEDSRGLLWLATRNGLKVIDREHRKLHDIPLRDNIVQLFVHSIIEDNGGSMWVTEGSSLTNLKVDFDERNGELKVTSRTYDSRDGLQDCEFNQRSFAKLPSGEILLGGFYGINRFNPREIRYNTSRPKVMFSDLFIGNRNVSPGEEIDGRVVMKKGLNSGGVVELGPDVKEFSVYFGSNNYALPEKTVFQYRLVGFNDEWTSLREGINHVTYTNLSPGRYTLEVKAANNDGYESVKAAELKIYVHAPFWATPVAFIIYALLATLAGYLAMRMIRKVERRRFERKRKDDAMRKEEELNQLKFKFFTNVSHDLRTPLTLIVSPLEAMLKESKDEKATKRLTMMRDNAMKLLHLVNQLLDFRKMDMKGLQLSPSEGDIVAFTKGVCSSFTGMSERKGINLTFYSSQERIEMIFDPDKMEKILMNLLGNAFKFTPAGGRVDVSLESVGENGGTLRIKVADTGVGISDKDKPHIFERFYQVDDNGESHPGMGSGIGLSMVSEYVRLHGGTVRVADNVDRGSVFVIEMPIKTYRLSKASEDSESSENSESSEHSEKSRKSGKGLPVALVVDDNPDLTEMLKDGLADSFEVVTAADGVEALEKLKTVTPGIIVADLMMPRMDGIELTRHLKASPQTSGIPVIILTARHDLDVKVEGLTVGADDYITKPFNIDVVRLRMKRLVELTAKGGGRNLIDPEPENIHITPLDEKFIAKAVEYVSVNMASSELSVEDLASHLGMSRVRLYKKLKQITGKTPIEFIRVIRLKRAAQLLRESQLNVSEIAYQTGFNNPKVFSKYFKEEFGILPSVYQDREGTETNYTV